MRTIQTIPAGSAVVIAGTNGAAVNYRTREPVPAPDGPDGGPGVPDVCPLTGAAVRAVDFRGYRVYFPAALTRFVNPDAERIVRAGRFVQLQYDIPERGGVPAADNPSGALRRIGIRTSYSVWVLPENRVPYPLLDALNRAGVRTAVVPFAADAAPALVDSAINALRREIGEALDRAERTRADAAAALDAADADPSADRARAADRADRRAADVDARLRALFADLETAARGFGLDPDDFRLGVARNAAAGIADSFAARAALYVRATAALRALGTADARALAAGADAGAVPAGVVADALRDSGDPDAETTADALNAAFPDGGF